MSGDTDLINTVRFWIMWNNSDCRLSLRDGEQVKCVCGGLTEEGYYYSTNWFKRVGDTVYRDVNSRSQDCDGPFEFWGESCFKITYQEEWAMGTCYLGPQFETTGCLGWPMWQHVETIQRDYYAESMNY